MSDIGLDELPEDVARLLGDARELRGPSDAARAKMKERLISALPLPPAGPGGGGDGAEPPAGTAGGSFFPRIPAWVAAATFVVGLGAGAFVRPLAAQSAGPSASVAALPAIPSVALTTVAEVGSGGTSLPTLEPRDLPLVASAKPVPSVAQLQAHGPDNRDLAAEQAVLDVGRTALGRGDADNALSATAEHAKKFPRGALSEEREAIAVQALALGGKKEEAKARAERFKKAHPESILLPAVLAAGGAP